MKYSEDKTKDKINTAFIENFILLWQSEKIPNHTTKFCKMAKCVFSCPAHFKNGKIIQNWP